MTGTILPSAGAVVIDAEDRLLLVRRRFDPGAGLWSIPGGKRKPGESSARAAVRETFEETGLEVRPVRLLGEQFLPNGESSWFDNADWLVETVGGCLEANDDAAEVRWFTCDEVAEADSAAVLTEGLLGYLRDYGVFDAVDR